MVLDVITFTTMIRACRLVSQPERAMEILEAMRRQGIVPSLIAYSALIRSCENSKQPGRALEAHDVSQCPQQGHVFVGLDLGRFSVEGKFRHVHLVTARSTIECG